MPFTMPFNQRGLKESQNFIRSSQLVRDLLDLTSIGPNDTVVEIGPGTGIITRELIARAQHVIAVEKDATFLDQLNSLKQRGSVEIILADFMQFCLPSKAYKVFANIPFNYTADIVSKLTSPPSAPIDAYLIIQRAAAERFAGNPYSRNTQASVLLALDFRVQILCPVSRSEFQPKPNVDVAFVHFGKRFEPLIPVDKRQSVRDFIIYSYNRWAPSVLESLAGVFTKTQRMQISKAFAWVNQKPTELSVEQWIELYRSFEKYVSEDKRRSVLGAENRLRQAQSRLTKQHRTRQ